MLNISELLRKIPSTEVNDIQAEERVKSVAPLLKGYTTHENVSYGVAAHSS